MHNGTTLSELDQAVKKAIDGRGEFEVRVQIVSNGGVVMHTFPSEQIVLSVSVKCAGYKEAFAAYEYARKQLGAE